MVFNSNHTGNSYNDYTDTDTSTDTDTNTYSTYIHTIYCIYAVL